MLGLPAARGELCGPGHAAAVLERLTVAATPHGRSHVDDDEIVPFPSSLLVTAGRVLVIGSEVLMRPIAWRSFWGHGPPNVNDRFSFCSTCCDSVRAKEVPDTVLFHV